MTALSWTDLFDACYVEHVVETVAGVPPDIATGLRNELLPALAQYQAEQRHRHIGVEAAERLEEIVEDVAAGLEGLDWRDCSADTMAEGARLAAELRLAWLEFIANAGGHRTSYDLPRELAAKAKERADGRKARQSSKPFRKLPPDDDVLAKLEENERSGLSPQDARAKLHARYRATATRSAINKALNRARKKRGI